MDVLSLSAEEGKESWAEDDCGVWRGARRQGLLFSKNTHSPVVKAGMSEPKEDRVYCWKILA